MATTEHEIASGISFALSDERLQPIFELAVHKHDGTHVTTTSNRDERFDPGDVLEGEGYIEWCVNDLRLAPGTYYFSPKLIDQTGVHTLDEQERWYRIQVRKGTYEQTGGSAILPARWSHVRPIPIWPKDAI